MRVSRRQIACQHLGNPPQLADRYAERNYDEAANGRGGAGADKCISEAKFVDRNAKSDITSPATRAKVPTLNSNTAILYDPLSTSTFAAAFRLNSSGKGKFSLFRKPAATTK